VKEVLTTCGCAMVVQMFESTTVGVSVEGRVVWGEQEVGRQRPGSPVSCITDMQHCAQLRQCTDFRRAWKSLTQSAKPHRLCPLGIHTGPKFSMHGSHAAPSPMSAMPSGGRGSEQRTGALKGECDPACWAFRHTWNAGMLAAILLCSSRSLRPLQGPPVFVMCFICVAARLAVIAHQEVCAVWIFAAALAINRNRIKYRLPVPLRPMPYDFATTSSLNIFPQHARQRAGRDRSTHSWLGAGWLLLLRYCCDAI
jgi:hypothetical protein